MPSLWLAAKTALVELLQANSELQGIQVSYNFPGRDVANEFIFLGDVEFEQEWATLGAGKRNETFTITGWVVVSQTGKTQYEAEERAGELVQIVEAAVLAKAANLLVNVWNTQFLRGTVNQGAGPEGFDSQIQFSIRCQSRI